MTGVKTCAVVQGNLRRGTDAVIDCLTRHFDIVILSTWDDEPLDAFSGMGIDIVSSKKPDVPGYSHRNYQRLGVSAGLRRAEEFGATHVLKWRTDMLPTKLDVSQLLEWSQYDPPTEYGSRLVTCAFRNLSVEPDWFSSIPDYFAFGATPLVKLLWDDADFDYTKTMNIPEKMLKNCGHEWSNKHDTNTTYGPETELYAIFRNRLETSLGKELNHPTIAKQFMRLFNHERMSICWFGANGYRSIIQATQHHWWTESIWLNGQPNISAPGYLESSWAQPIMRKCLTPLARKREIYLQKRWYAAYIPLSL